MENYNILVMLLCNVKMKSRCFELNIEFHLLNDRFTSRRYRCILHDRHFTFFFFIGKKLSNVMDKYFNHQ